MIVQFFLKSTVPVRMSEDALFVPSAMSHDTLEDVAYFFLAKLACILFGFFLA